MEIGEAQQFLLNDGCEVVKPVHWLMAGVLASAISGVELGAIV